jgi:dihydroflavonol-4-reductase
MLFVTGGTGLIGAHLLYELVSADKKVKALKRETSNLQHVLKIFSYYTDSPEELFRKIEWVNGDMLDCFGLEKLLQGVNEVYHCAAVVSFNPGERSKMIANNVAGTANMVNAALENGVEKFCHVSSVAALGHVPGGFFVDEETNWVPFKEVTGYSESKFFSETEIWRGIEEGMDAVIVNPSIVLGPGNWNSGSSLLFKTVWNGMKFYPAGGSGFVDVKDVTRAMVLLMDKSYFENCKNQRFLLNSENWSYKALFSQMADALGKPRPGILASKFLLAIAWRAAAVYGWITSHSPAITRETAASSCAVRKFEGNKIKRFVNFEYLPVSVSISQTASFLKQELENS